ncbi:alpha/beta hydrolase [Paenarthrobacter sp. NPDC089675]|uniref:alpha/beta hydrolase n=1 Tax=Paenarthrobacter sp. NPDC089675 TaxID=3364376 RepID=UPI0037F76B54
MTPTSHTEHEQFSIDAARGLLPEIESRVSVLKNVNGWADFSPEVLGVWSAPYGSPELWSVKIQHRTIDGPHGPIPVRIYRSNDSKDGHPGLVWFHGGAFVGGALDMPEAHETSLGISGRAKMTVISVDYRLCPSPGQPATTGDVRFPIPHDEAVEAYRWAVKMADELGMDPSKIAVGGASAGANLAAGAALRLAHDGAPPWQALLAYPLVHPTMPTMSEDLEDAIQRIPPALRLTAESWISLNENYLGGAVESASEYAYVGVSRDLSRFPSTYIDNCEFDEIRISGEAFARQLEESGVDVEVAMTNGVLHGHLNNVGFKPARDSMDNFARRLTSWTGKDAV